MQRSKKPKQVGGSSRSDPLPQPQSDTTTKENEGPSMRKICVHTNRRLSLHNNCS